LEINYINATFADNEVVSFTNFTVSPLAPKKQFKELVQEIIKRQT
jgi:hypothetical protein